MSWLKGWLAGGSDELGWDDVASRIVDAVARRRRFGRRGEVMLPPEARVTVVAPPEHVEALRTMVADPDLDRRVRADLANRCDCEVSALPLLSYMVAEGPGFDVKVEEQPGTVTWEILINGGDQSGVHLAVPGNKSEIRFGRGEWHGGDAQIRNDLVVSNADGFVSRRAGRLVRVGNGFEVEAVDQGDFLIVHREGEGGIRPARCASGRVALRPGDEIELISGTGESLRLTLRRGAE